MRRSAGPRWEVDVFPPSKDGVVLYNARDSYTPAKLKCSSFVGDPVFDDPDVMDAYLTSCLHYIVEQRGIRRRLTIRRKPSK